MSTEQVAYSAKNNFKIKIKNLSVEKEAIFDHRLIPEKIRRKNNSISTRIFLKK